MVYVQARVEFRTSVDAKERWLREAGERGVGLSELIRLAMEAYLDLEAAEPPVVRAKFEPVAPEPVVLLEKRSYEPDWR